MTTTTATTTMTMTMTTEAVAEPLIAARTRTASSRRPHAAAGSRTVTLALSITVTAGMMIAMGSADAQSTTIVGWEPLPSLPGTAVATVSRPNILLPVPASGGAVATPSAPTVSSATPQPIMLQPQRRVVVKSNGSR